MKQVTIYEVTIRGTHRVEADNLQQAIDRTVEYFAAHLDELNYPTTEEIVWVEEEEV